MSNNQGQSENGKQDRGCLAVLTSGGDAPGMNAAIRAVVRTAYHEGKKVFAISDGYRGLVENKIQEMKWPSVSSIIQHGGTVIGSDRYPDFSYRAKKLDAALNLVEKGIDRLVIIGGDGTLTGAYKFHMEWPKLLEELLKQKKITQVQKDCHEKLTVAGIVGSIDNDMSGTDLTIGANTALHRIIEGVDPISSTAHSHKRTFVIQVMGRNCGYLALMSALVTGADWVIIPENPPENGKWQNEMCEALNEGKKMGREATIVILAEGVRDTKKRKITKQEVKQALIDGFDKNVRDVELGHIQRGGSPSALDRYLSTLLGYNAVKVCLNPEEKGKAKAICVKEGKITPRELNEILKINKKMNMAIKKQRCHQEKDIFSDCFNETLSIEKILRKPRASDSKDGKDKFSFAVLHCGTPTPGMNAAVRAAVRLANDRGHKIFGVKRGIEGLINSELEEEDWMSVNRLAPMGGAKLGSSHKIPMADEFQHINNNLNEKKIKGLLIIGGISGYQSAYELFRERTRFNGFKIPIICLPATINNNLPGSEYSIGSDTALNNIIGAVDKIKQSDVASPRCFIVEVAGGFCGYLALISGITSGAEQIYLHEEGVTLDKLQADMERLRSDFNVNRQLALIVRNQKAYGSYDTNFITALFKQEGKGIFEVFPYKPGALQYEGNPSPCDRILATRMANKCIDRLIKNAEQKNTACEFIGINDGKMGFGNLEDFPDMVDSEFERPKRKNLWWLKLKDVAKMMSSQERPGM